MLNIGYLKVDKEHQSKGVGKMLLEAAEKVAVARSWPFKTTSLAVLEANVKGQHCYKSQASKFCYSPRAASQMMAPKRNG